MHIVVRIANSLAYLNDTQQRDRQILLDLLPLSSRRWYIWRVAGDRHPVIERCSESRCLCDRRLDLAARQHRGAGEGGWLGEHDRHLRASAPQA
jgi:hypothetical protein